MPRMAIVIRYMCCLVFVSRSSDLIQYGGIVTKANSLNFEVLNLRCTKELQKFASTKVLIPKLGLREL